MSAVRFLDLAAGNREARGQLERAFADVLDSGRYVLGRQVEAFEREFAAYCGVRFCVGVSSGLEALHLILRALGVRGDDEVLVPGNTFIATWMAVSHAGATPVPVDPDPATHNIDPDRIEAAITPRTKAIVPVHLYGRPAPMRAIAEIARRYGLAVVEDAAQAHGAAIGGVRAGALGHAAAFSFYPVKNLGALGDAGAVTTDDPELAARVRLLRSYGAARRGESEALGFNARLDELQAALLRVKLGRLDAANARRGELAGRYLSGLAGTGLGLPAAGPGEAPAWHLFVVRSGRRDELRHRLAEDGVETMVHYARAPHLQPAYEGLVAPGALPVSELLQDEVLSLPLHPHLTDEEADRVIAACRR